MVGNLVVISKAALDCITATIISHPHQLVMLFAHLSKVSHFISTSDLGRLFFMESHSDPKALSYGLYEVITLSNSQQLYCHCMCPSKTGLLMLGKRPHEFISVMGFSLWSRCKTWREKRRRVWVLPFRHKFKCEPNPAPNNVLYDFCDYTRGPLYSIQHTFCHSTPCFWQWTKIALDPFMICTVQCFF